jgi:hypothetical protein
LSFLTFSKAAALASSSFFNGTCAAIPPIARIPLYGNVEPTLNTHP